MVEPVSDVFIMPATPSQMRFWSLHQLHPDNHALNMPLAWKCQGKLDRKLVAATLLELLQRHESLRTTFDIVEGHLSQVIQPAFEIPLPVDELQYLPAEERQRQADIIIRREARIQMDMKEGPLLFARLIQMDAQEHILLLTIHHSVCDGWSNGVILRDFAAIYDGLVSQRQPSLPELPIQFGDFAVWQDEWRKGSGSAESLEFWRRTLEGNFTPLQIHRDFSSAKAAEEGEIESYLLPPDLVEQVRAFCAAEGITLYMLFFSIFAATLYRFTSQRDFIVGSPCANRRPGTEDLIGTFANPQVLRVRIQQQDTFRALLEQVRDWTVAVYSHQDLPFEDLIDDPFFAEERNQIQLQVYFLYQKAFMQAQHTSTLDITPLRSVSPGAMFDLMLGVVERTEGPRLQLEYNPAFFRATTIQRILTSYVEILRSVLEDATREVATLGVLGPAERKQVLEDWNKTKVDFGPFEAVHRQIERRAAETPQRTAAICAGQEWNYRQLNEYANRIARYLRHQGAREGTVVGVCVERSLQMLAAVLGILKTGAAYLPLDPQHPADRLTMLLEDAEVPMLLTEERLTSNLHTKARVICLDAEQSLWEQESSADLDGVTRQDSLAYVIYTSGSTGRPKGVAIEHGALLNLLRSMEREPGLNSSDTLVAVTTLSFDIAALELFLPLMVGARLVLATSDQARDGYQLRALLEQSQATVLQSTPGTWRMFLEADWNGDPRLKVLCGGDALPRDLADALAERSGDVWNLYGPTETTVWSSATRVRKESGPVVIGPPIANTQFYILDALRQPVPVGVTGELYIGGEGVARGYWRQPDLTAEKFLPNPFAPGRIYRTGDLARWREDGHVELLGRADHQVKIRGYRIELGEIEAALTEHPAVRDAVVVAVDDGMGDKYLAAYVDSALPEPPADLVPQLQGLLAAKLPESMLPSAITALKQLPRTSNGKIDRKALPAPLLPLSARDQANLANAPLAPRSPLEKQLAELWENALGIKNISIRENFFDLGGRSLIAMRLISRINKTYSLDFGLATLLSGNTVERMAELIQKRLAPNTASSIVLMQPLGSAPPLFIFHGAGGNILRFYPLSMLVGTDRPIYGVQAQSLQPHQPALLKLEDLASYYLSEIRTVQPKGPYYFLGYSFGGLLAFEMAQQLQAAGEQVALLGMLDARQHDHVVEMLKSDSLRLRFKRRMTRFSNNTAPFSIREKLAYFGDKLRTRTLRWSYMALTALNIWTVPSFMKSTDDISVVAVIRYRPRPYAGRITIFKASEQPDPRMPRDLGWGPLTLEGVDIYDLPGDHDLIFREPNISVLAEQLENCLKR